MKSVLGMIYRTSNNPSSVCFRRNISTAGILVIGDEILKGEVQDINSNFICQQLHKLGTRVNKISVVGDDIDAICYEIRDLSAKYEFVITTGGIGPTHDDVTYEALAKAFDEKVTLHPELYEICAKFFKTTDKDHPGMKLARVPESAKLCYAIDAKYPCVSVRNVYTFPGVPGLLQNSLSRLGPQLFGGDGAVRFHTCDLYVGVVETEIIPALDRVVEEFPQAKIGSYPTFCNEFYKVRITAEAASEEYAAKTIERLAELVPDGSKVCYDPHPMENSKSKLNALCNELPLIAPALEQCAGTTPILFDVGLPSRALLHLCHVARAESSLRVLALHAPKEARHFLKQMSACYNFDICFVESPAELSALFANGEVLSATPVKGVSFRVLNPLANWKYGDVLSFIERLCLPYYKQT